jgi:hypothetical protein
MAKRDVNKAKTAKALRKLRKVAERAAEPDAPKLTAWEHDFVAGVSSRLETYGSAFRDLSKGRAEEALSDRQTAIARVIDRKVRPKPAKTTPKAGASTSTPDDAGKPPPRSASGLRRSTFKPKGPPPSRARVRHVDDDLPTGSAADPPSLRVVAGAPASVRPRRAAPAPGLRVIRGGKRDPGRDEPR